MHKARFILNGYQYSYLSLAEARSARRISCYGGARRLMSRDMVNHTKVNAICDWEFSKNRLMKLAVRMAISGNMLMMLARSRSDENNERKCVTVSAVCLITRRVIGSRMSMSSLVPVKYVELISSLMISFRG